jgi:LPS O-antigen subunit length determinant protein (WzzB/FepE family)
MNQVEDAEIDLFELFRTLWDGKKVISAFVAIAVLLGGSFIFFKTPLYKSELFYSIDTIPPFYSDTKVSNDFKLNFFSKSIFKDWKKSNDNTSLVFEDFNTSEIVNGFILSKDENNQLAILNEDKKMGSHILVKSEQLSVLDDFFNYAGYINEILKTEYKNRAKEELNIIETRFKDFSAANDAIISQILSIDRYIVSAEKGAKVLIINRPTLPEKISPRSILILALSIILGGIIGVTYVLISNAICKRR